MTRYLFSSLGKLSRLNSRLISWVLWKPKGSQKQFHGFYFLCWQIREALIGMILLFVFIFCHTLRHFVMVCCLWLLVYFLRFILNKCAGHGWSDWSEVGFRAALFWWDNKVVAGVGCHGVCLLSATLKVKPLGPVHTHNAAKHYIVIYRDIISQVVFKYLII